MAEENNNDWRAQTGSQPAQGDAQQAAPVNDGQTAPIQTSAAGDAGGQPTVTLPTTPDATPASLSETTPIEPLTGTFSHVPSTTSESAPTAPTASASSDDTPNYAAAAGESTVVSSAPTSQPAGDQPSNEQPTQQYRPAPEYGAYGPTPTVQPGQGGAQPVGQNAQQPSGQPQQNQPFGGLFGNPFGQNPTNGQTESNQQNAGRNPFGNPFLAGQNQTNQTNAAPNAGQQPANGQQPPFPPYGNPFGPANGQPGQPGAPAAKTGSKTASGVVIAVVAALVSAALCLGVGYYGLTNGWVTIPNSSSLANVNSNKSGSGSATTKSGEAVDWSSVASSVSDSVVSITTTLSNGTAKGSGAILDTEGHIVTNNHVISGAQSIAVTLANGNMYSAKVVGTDTTTDLAVIKLDNPPSDLKAVEFADSDKLAVGEAVMAIGNPLGYDDTATTGIVSALNRPVTVTDDNNNQIVTNAVQIDAAINPGNSGGPTFNGAGQVIGINSSIASTATSSESAGSIGIGFAIPANLVKRVADEIIKDGSVTHVALGITVTTDTVTADGVTRSGAKITQPSSGGSAVVSGGPADKAGLKAGDTIVAFNGNAVNSHYALLGFVRASALGDKVTLTIVRDGKTMDVDVTLDQEESSVNGSSSSNGSSNGNSNGNSGGSDGSNGYGNGSNGYGNGSDGNSNGNNDGGTGDDGGFSDPFGLW
ncbi:MULTISPECIES: S1C family serine protease [Bifidobacterium]|uniref:S1C family serine protease n=1 Tax=Bifidobacterium TaxID=1678 RepID=UPI001BDDBB78|nr:MULTISPECIES: trypsin-like peptidase domain-containing protein [Bifidobacterium]MBT1160681.1 trypsin-like peptidase domain-containing protein [Bifidobacterium sp. SO1]MBW3079481.1 trypsin-like peptidase domain-containing protein [Bifidobacterium simiiventris]